MSVTKQKSLEELQKEVGEFQVKVYGTKAAIPKTIDKCLTKLESYKKIWNSKKD